MTSIIISSSLGLLMRTAISMVTSELLMKSFKETTDSIYNKILFLSNINDNSIKEIIKYIKDSDLEFRLKHIDVYLKKLGEKHNNDKDYKDILIGIQETILNINTGLRNLENAIKHHDTKYFNRWRSFTPPYSLNDIKSDNNILNTRLEFIKNFEIL